MNGLGISGFISESPTVGQPQLSLIARHGFQEFYLVVSFILEQHLILSFNFLLDQRHHLESAEDGVALARLDEHLIPLFVLSRVLKLYFNIKVGGGDLQVVFTSLELAPKVLDFAKVQDVARICVRLLVLILEHTVFYLGESRFEGRPAAKLDHTFNGQTTWYVGCSNHFGIRQVGRLTSHQSLQVVFGVLFARISRVYFSYSNLQSTIIDQLSRGLSSCFYLWSWLFFFDFFLFRTFLYKPVVRVGQLVVAPGTCV